MSKKMKKVAFDPLPYGAYEDAKTRFKHQTLIQDYQELQKEVEATRNKLDTVKQRKHILLAEVRFLRRRHKYLVKDKYANSPQERLLVQSQKVETQQKKKKTNQMCGRRTASCNLPLSHVTNQKGRMQTGKEAASRKAAPLSAVNHKKALHSGKVVTLLNPTPVSDLNHRARMFGGKDAAFHNSTPVIDFNQNSRIYSGKNAGQLIDLNQKEKNQVGKEAASRNQAPIFDLNEVSREEDEFLNNYEALRLEELKKGLIRDGIDEQQLNDLKLPICRNVGDGSSRMGKRKISWQDPVALRV